MIRVQPILVGLWLALIFFSSTNTAWRVADRAYVAVLGILHWRQTGQALLFAQKGFHVFLFVGLAFLLWNSIKGRALNKLLVVSVACFITGSLSEGLQMYFPGRNASLMDVLLNGLSGTTAAALMAVREAAGSRKPIGT